MRQWSGYCVHKDVHVECSHVLLSPKKPPARSPVLFSTILPLLAPQWSICIVSHYAGLAGHGTTYTVWGQMA